MAREDPDRAAARLVGQPVQDEAPQATRLPCVREEQPDLGALPIGAALEAGESHTPAVGMIVSHRRTWPLPMD